MLVYDIETGPLPDETIKALSPPFEPKAKHPGEFSPAAVKLGLLKDQAKIDAKIADAKAKHEKAVEDFASAVEKEESEYWTNILDRAALSAITGRILAIGYKGEKAQMIDHIAIHSVDAEVKICQRFWSKFVECQKSRRPMVGFNSNYFDVPFIYQRSLILSVDIPAAVFDGKWLTKSFVDLLDYWRLGNRQIWNKLDSISKAMGIGEKPEGISGKDFSRLYFGTADERKQALKYLEGDLDLTWQFACRVGLAK
jgi:uncharacterized protein YprB with RNaseH-like and TPR domain